MKNLMKMPKSKLDKFLADYNIKDQIMTGKVNALIDIMESEYGIMTDNDDDNQTKQIMEIWATGDFANSDEYLEKLEKEKSKNTDIEFG